MNKPDFIQEQDPNIISACPEEVAVVNQVARLAVRGLEPNYYGRRIAYLPVPQGEYRETVEVHVHEDGTTMVLHRQDEFGLNGSAVFTEPAGFGSSTHYIGSGKFKPRNAEDMADSRFTSESAQRLISKVAAAAQLYPRTDYINR